MKKLWLLLLILIIVSCNADLSSDNEIINIEVSITSETTNKLCFVQTTYSSSLATKLPFKKMYSLPDKQIFNIPFSLSILALEQDMEVNIIIDISNKDIYEERVLLILNKPYYLTIE